MGVIAEKPAKTRSLHQRDFYAWTQEQVRLLRAGNLHRLDVENLIEEVEDMGRSEAAALESAIEQALIHLIKLALSPASDPRAEWEVSVVKQRVAIEKLLKVNPGLQSRLGEFFDDAWISAREIANAELAVYKEFPVIPADCPFDLAKVRNKSYWPARAA